MRINLNRVSQRNESGRAPGESAPEEDTEREDHSHTQLFEADKFE